MFRVWLLVVVSALLVAAGPGAAPAAEPDEPGAAGHKEPDKAHGGAKDHTGADAEEVKNPLAPALDLTIWTSIVFLLLLTVLYLTAWKPILQALNNREERIRSALEEAQLARAESQRMREEFERDRAQAHEEVRKMLDEGRRDAERLREEIKAQGQAEVQADRQRLRREIDTARDQALAQISERAADLAAVISAKVLRRQLDPNDHRRLIDEALADLEGAGKKRASVLESVV
jgi:F-type H+-transporting ATPase subunit b